MRKKLAKRMTAAALAVAMLAGVLALPASAAADEAYTQELAQVMDQGTDLWRDGLQRMMQKYPNSPEPYYWYATSYWTAWRNEEETFDAATARQLVGYLDQAVALGLQSTHPFQSKWYDGEYPYPSMEGFEQDYTTQSAQMKADLQMWMLGQQEQGINSMQQYLDCWDRWLRIDLSEVDQQMESNIQGYISEGYSADQAREMAQEFRQWSIDDDNELLNQTIPELRAELDSIRQWYTSGASSFDVGWNTQDGQEYGYLHVTGGKGDKSLTLTEVRTSGQNYTTRVTTSRAIVGVQRTLDAITVFVPKGTQITVNGSGYIPDRQYTNEPGRWTATETPHIVAWPVGDYNGGSVYVYIVGV